ncbi:MAG: InlB B-repeat-containing protein [Planctomycetes bacterium]|nr:InlB B-repeat-containing protein [Planctomycetota bacterium]
MSLRYYLWARVRYDSYQHNSFWVAFDHSANFPWRFSDQLTGSWHWQRLGSISGLSSGDHKLFLKLREELTQVDKFLVTSDAGFTPEGLGDPAENSCGDPAPGDGAECDLCDPQINLGDLVVLRDPFYPNDAFDGWPAIVVGKEAGHYALLTHRELTHMAPYAQPQAPQGQGFPYDWDRYRVAVPDPDPFKHTIIVPERSLEQYLDCRGLLSFHWDAQRQAFTGSFRSDEGWSGDIDIMRGVVPDGISAGDNDNMRLQGMLHSSENTVFYPLVSSTLRPLAREGDVVIREILNNPYPPANTYGLGVIECWNLDRPGESKIISLTDLVGSGGPVFGGARDGVGPSNPPSDSERLTCITVHLRPSPFDFTETGSFISYVCSDCGVIRRVDRYQPKFENGRMSDSDYALVFEGTQECYMLPQGLHFGSWSDLEGEHYRLAGFQEYAGPAGTGFGQVSIGGVSYRRIGFLAAPVAVFPCTEDPVKMYTLEVTSSNGGRATPAEGSFTHNAGTVITLTAVADPGYAFDGWTTIGVPTGTINPASATVSFAMNGNYRFHANFKRIPVPVTYTLRVSSDTGGHVTPAEGSFTHNPGTWVALTAVADPGYTFAGWTTTGIPAGTINPANPAVWFAMNGNYTFHAKFKRDHVPVTYTLKVSSDTGGKVIPAEGTFTFSPGTWVALMAIADPGYAFDGWTTTGLPAGTINPADAMVFFPMNGNYTLHARFKGHQVPVTYVLHVSSDAGGHVTPAEGRFTYNGGTVVTLTAVPDAGYSFDRWSTTVIPPGTIDPTNPTATFAVNGNYLFYARFKRGAQNLPNLTDGGLVYRDIHPQVVYRGDTVNVSFRLRNNGAATAADGNGLVRIAYFASTDTTITSADHPLGNESTWSLPAGQYRDITVPLKVPNSIPRNSYYVGWIIDPFNGIQESNENDNVAFKQSKKLTVR